MKPPSIAIDNSPSTTWRYGRTAVVFHWALALLIVATTGLGWYMMSVEEEPGSGRFFDLHKSIGIVIAALVVARLLWRTTHRPLPLPAHVPKWQVQLANASQALLYLLMVAMPITGYLGGSYSKAGVGLFGLPTPRWAVADHDTAEQFFGIHSALAWVLVAVVVLHLLGALKHLLIDKDGVFQRML